MKQSQYFILMCNIYIILAQVVSNWCSGIVLGVQRFGITQGNGMIFVHRYKWSHDSLRRRYRKLLKAGKVRIHSQNKKGWWYERL